MDTPPSVPLFRRSWFWVALILISAAAATLSLRLFPKAFPLVTLDIHMDRGHAIRAARELATQHHWGPSDSVREAAAFHGLGAAQAFVELEGGGKPAFADLLHDDLFSAYVWEVRLFKESETRQVVVRFKPTGASYGFTETLREDAPGAALAAEAARAIAEAAVRAAPWNFPLDRVKLVESSQVTRPGGRIDHTFVYERPDRQLGEGRLRVALVVGGDRLTAFTQFVKVPEAFSRRYEQMRSANNAIAAGASITMVLLYVLGGCGVGLFFLMRQRAVLWRQPLVWAGVIAGLQLLASLNAWPLAWLNYDTALSAGGFVTERLVSLVAGTLAMGLVLFLSFLAAEGLTRRAFPHHPQFWKLWSRDAGATREVLGRTIGGYVFASITILYVLVFYYFAIRRLGWWSPSEALTDPDLLAHYLPWLTPFARAAQAGFWEETLFRAIPLAGGALLGARFGGRRWWILGAFILQALVFSAAHANYPGQPAYSRLVELLLPSCVFGGFYLVFGLLPSILLHFTYDVVLMALPLFAATAPGIWLDRTVLVLITLIPLWIILWRRWQAGAWCELPAALRNAAWQPPAAAPVEPVAAASEAAPTVLPSRLPVIVLVLGLAGIVGWVATSPFTRFGPPLDASRDEAVRLARVELDRRGVKLPTKFRADARIGGRPDTAERFIWQTAGRETYESLLGRFLPPAHWQVRFATFEGDVAERAEEWNVFINGVGGVQRVEHRVPEARAGASLTEVQTRERVHAAIREKWSLDPASLKEVSATSAKRPNRTDWTFVFKDPALKSIAPGEARFEVELSGDEVTDTGRFIFVPENWERADRALQSSFRIGSIVKGVTLGLLVLSGIGLAIAAWSRGRFAVRIAVLVATLLFVTTAVTALNQWPATVAHFSTAQPLSLQRTIALAGPLVGGLIAAIGLGLLAGLAVRWVRPSPLNGRSATWLGVGTGGLLVGGLALAALPRAGIGPDWPSLAPAGTWWPWVAPTLGVVGQFLSQTTTLLFVAGGLDRLTTGWQRRRGLGFVLAFVASAAISLPWGGPTLAAWLLAALAATVVVTLVYLFVIRRDVTVVPLVAGVAGALALLDGGISHAYSGALFGSLLAAAVSLALGGAATILLRGFARAAADVPPSA